MPSELLTEVESKVKERVKELRPLHDEYLELQAYAERAGISLNGNSAKPAAAAKPKPAPKRKPAARRKAAQKPAAKSSTSSRFPNGVPDRRADLLRVVTENPGLTVREAGEKLGTDATQLYRHRNKLVEEGLLESRGPNLFPKTATPAASETPGEGDGAGA